MGTGHESARPTDHSHTLSLIGQPSSGGKRRLDVASGAESQCPAGQLPPLRRSLDKEHMTNPPSQKSSFDIQPLPHAAGQLFSSPLTASISSFPGCDACCTVDVSSEGVAIRSKVAHASLCWADMQPERHCHMSPEKTGSQQADN